MIGFKYAIKGLVSSFKSEFNMKFDFVAMILVVAAGFIFNITTLNWIVIISCIVFVFVAELFNTAIEHIVDFISPDHHILAGTIKDVSAAAVLVTAIGALVIGLIIFVPEIKDFLNN